MTLKLAQTSVAKCRPSVPRTGLIFFWQNPVYSMVVVFIYTRSVFSINIRIVVDVSVPWSHNFLNKAQYPDFWL